MIYPNAIGYFRSSGHPAVEDKPTHVDSPQLCEVIDIEKLCDEMIRDSPHSAAAIRAGKKALELLKIRACVRAGLRVNPRVVKEMLDKKLSAEATSP